MNTTVIAAVIIIFTIHYGTAPRTVLCGNPSEALMYLPTEIPIQNPNVKGISMDDEESIIDKYRTSLSIRLSGYLICAAIDLAILVVYVALWGHHSCYGWSIMAVVISFLSWYACAATIIATILSTRFTLFTTFGFNTVMWAIARVTSIFVFASIYSWTLVLAYHVWKTLRALSPRSTGSQGFRQFLKYCTFGYGLPICVTGISLAVIFSANTNGGLVRSLHLGFATYRYWIFYLPAGLIFVVNVILLFSTLKWLRQAKKDREGLRIHGQSTESPVYTNAILVCKLVVLMGGFFTFDIIHSLLDILGVDEESGFPASLDLVYSILQSGCLFWIFVWNKEIRKQLGTKFPRYIRPFAGQLADSAVMNGIFPSHISTH